MARRSRAASAEPNSAAPLVLRLFGGFWLEDGAGEAVRLPLRKGQAMVAYLACSPGQPVPREKLATLLWGDRGHDQARQNLRQALHAIRRAFEHRGASPLRLENQLVSLDPGAVWVDAVEAETLVADGSHAALARAAELYAGEFLSDLRIDAAEFEDWVEFTRRRFRDLALQALSGLIEHAFRSGKPDSAIEAAQRALAIDPCREDLHRRLMQLYLSKGMRSSALAQYRHCRAVLQRELDAPPDGETNRLYRHILQSDFEAARTAWPRTDTAAFPDPPDDAGRRAQLDALLRRFGDAGWSRQGLVLIVGDAGAGKTHLVDALARDLSARGGKVLRARARPTELVLRLAPWTELLDREGASDPAAAAASAIVGLAEQRAGFSWVAGSTDGGAAVARRDPSSVCTAVLEMLRRRGADGPILFVFEDLDRADVDSLRVLFDVMRRARRMAASFLATARPEDLERRIELSAALQDLAHEGSLRRVELAPLTREETGRLVEEARRRLDRAPLSQRAIGEIWTLSEGNPGIAIECLSAWDDRHDPGRRRARALGERTRRRIARSMSGLGDGARTLASLASLMAPRRELAVLRLAAGLSEEDVVRAVDELVAARVLTTDGQVVEFSRNVVGRALCEDLSGLRRRALHGRLARAIARVHGADLAVHCRDLGRHWRAAGEPARALPFEARAGLVDLNRGTWRSARRHLERAVRMAQVLDDGDVADPSWVEARLGLVSLAERDRDLDAARAVLGPLEPRLGAIDEARQRALVLHALARNYQSRNDETAAFAYARRALRECERDGAAHLWLPAERLLFRLHVVGRADSGPAQRALRAQERARALRLRRDEATAAGLRAVLHAARGDTDAAVAAAGESVRAAERLGDSGLVAGCLQVLGLVQAWHGDVDAALGNLERADALAEGQGDLIRRLAIRGHRGFALCLGRRHEEAVVDLRAALDQAERLETTAYRPHFLAWLAEAAVAGGDRETARRAARDALSLAARTNQPWPHAVALRALAQVLAGPDLRDPAGASAAIAWSLQQLGSLGLRVERARSLCVQSNIIR